MKTKTFINALGEIGDRYITEANEYTAVKKKRRLYRRVFAACAAVAALVFGAIPFLNGGASSAAPFVLTAYALEDDNTLSSAALSEGDTIPVSLFETESGLWGFVFSYDAGDPNQPASIMIISADLQSTGTPADNIKDICGLEIEQGKNYLNYIPPQNEPEPHVFTFPITAESADTVIRFNIVIEQSGDGYTARIGEITTYDRR